ncbi:MAG: hypothetical protein AAGU19_08835 [Prolixibacteraceae bacterium]
MNLQVFNKSGIQIAISGNFTYSAAAMGEKNISLTVESPVKIAFTPFCYVTFKNENYYLQSEPSIKRVAGSGYKGDALQYNLTFKSKQTDLVNCDFQDFILGSEVYFSGMSEFGFFGDVYDLARRIQANLNIEYSTNTWTIMMPCAGYTDPQPVSSIGISQRVLSGESKQITVSDENCWNALTRVFSDYGFNFYLDTTNRSIFIGVTYPTLSAGGQDIVFEYGSGKGLYEINRNIEDTGLTTRLRAYGSDKNIPTNYMALGQRVVTRLQLPSYRATQANTIPTDYVLANQSIIDFYGLRPGKKIFEDIYPTIEGITDGNGHRIDSIHAIDTIVDGKDADGNLTQPSFFVYLYDLGFDINDHITSNAATLAVKTGYCGGADFEIVQALPVVSGETYYSAGVRWKFKLNKNTSYSANYVLPSGNVVISAGDTFSLLNISMPDIYVIAAEQRLLTAAEEYLAENSRSKISYTVNLDEIYLANNPGVSDALLEGTNVKIIDNDLGDTTVDDITYYTVKSIQSLTIRYQSNSLLPAYNITLADKIQSGRIDRIENEISKTKDNVQNTNNQIDKSERSLSTALKTIRQLRPGFTFQGEYDPLRPYYGTNSRVDIVVYDDLHYITKPTSGIITGELPTNATYWEPFEGDYFSIATGLLFAELAYIENLGVENVRAGTVGGARLEISKESGAYYLKVYDASNDERIKIAAGVFEVKQDVNRFLRMNDTSTTLMALRADGGTGISIYTQDTTGKGIGITAQTGGKAIESYGNHKFTARSGELTELLGITKSEGTALGYSASESSGSIYLTYNQTFFNYYGVDPATIYLPSTAATGKITGKIYYIVRTSATTLTVNGNGSLLHWGDGSSGSSFETTNINWIWFFIYTGTFWQAGHFER